MTKKELNLIQGMIEKSILLTVPSSIEKTVNGKIREVKDIMENTKVCLDEHIEQHTKDTQDSKDFREKLEPFVQARAGGTFLFKGAIGLGSVAAAWIAVKSIFPSL